MRYFLDILTVSLKLSTYHVAQMKANTAIKTYSNSKIWPQYLGWKSLSFKIFLSR